MSKRRYQATKVKEIQAGTLRAALGHRAVVGVDVAKEDMFASLMDEQERVLTTMKWKHPKESLEFIGLLLQR